MSNVVKLSERKKAQEQAAKKAAAEQRARQNGMPTSGRSKIPLLILSIVIVLLGIFWEPVMQFLAGFLGRS